MGGWAIGEVWEQGKLCWRWQNNARREAGDSQDGRKYKKEGRE